MHLWRILLSSGAPGSPQNTQLPSRAPDLPPGALSSLRASPPSAGYRAGLPRGFPAPPPSEFCRNSAPLLRNSSQQIVARCCNGSGERGQSSRAGALRGASRALGSAQGSGLCYGELPRIRLPRTWVNKSKRRARALVRSPDPPLERSRDRLRISSWLAPCLKLGRRPSPWLALL